MATTISYPHTEDRLPNHPSFHPLPTQSLLTQTKAFLKRKYNPGPFTKVIPRIFPLLNLIKRGYSLTDTWIDALSGATLSTVLIPQSLSYCVLAGLKPQYGLYAAFFSGLIYWALGTTKELSVGPFALISILMGEMINAMYPDLDQMTQTDPIIGFSLRVTYIMTLTFCTGVWLVIMAVAKIGWIIDFVSSPAVNSLIMATALSVCASQLGSLFGVDTGQGSFLQCFIGLFKNIHKTNFLSLCIGIIGVIFLFLVDLYCQKKKLKVPLPSQIVLVVFVTLISALFNFHGNFNLSVVGDIPMGFISSTLPSFKLIFSNGSFLINGFLVAVVCFVISSSVSTQMADEHKYKVNFNSELFSLGICSLLGAFVNSYTSSASLSRTAVVNATKPPTNVWGLWSSLIVLLVILFMGPLLFHLPKAVLACVVIGSFRTQFLKYDQGWVLFKKSPVEGIVYFLTLFATLFISIQAGLIAAFVTSLLSVIIQISSYQPTFLLQVPSTQRFEHYHRFDLNPYYQYLDEIEGQGGLSKKKRPLGTKKNRRSEHFDDELYGLASPNDRVEGGYEQQLDDDSATTGSNTGSEGYTGFGVDNLNSPQTNNNINNTGQSAMNTVEMSNIGDIDESNNDKIYMDIIGVNQDPKVAVLHFGTNISFLNATPISDYITRYIEMHRQYYKTNANTPLLSDQVDNTVANNNNSQNVPTNSPAQNDFHLIAPQYLQTTLLDPFSNKTPQRSLKNSPEQYQSPFYNTHNRSISNLDNNIFGNDLNRPDSTRSSAQDNYNYHHGNHRDDPTHNDQYAGHDSNNSSHNSPPSFVFPPTSPSTSSSWSLLSNLQLKSFTALVYDTLQVYDTVKFNADLFSKYEFCIVLDSITGVDISGEAMLLKLQKQYPFVFFLFSRPSLSFLKFLLSNGRANGKNGVVGRWLPQSFLFNDVFLCTFYARYFLDMVQGAKQWASEHPEQIQIENGA